jgi:vanillate O-demethylase monooxygenase subunit
MGEAEKADPARLPGFEQIVDPDKATIRGYATIQANYELLADNLLDLSHAQFVHAQFLRTDALLSAPHEVSQQGDTVVSRRLASNTQGPASFMRYFDDREAPVDVWMRVRWDPPGLCRLDVGLTPTGRPECEGLRREGSHLLAPETETSTHYFYANTRNYRIHDPVCDEHVREWHRVGFGSRISLWSRRCRR